MGQAYPTIVWHSGLSGTNQKRSLAPLWSYLQKNTTQYIKKMVANLHQPWHPERGLLSPRLSGDQYWETVASRGEFVYLSCNLNICLRYPMATRWSDRLTQQYRCQWSILLNGRIDPIWRPKRHYVQYLFMWKVRTSHWHSIQHSKWWSHPIRSIAPVDGTSQAAQWSIVVIRSPNTSSTLQPTTPPLGPKKQNANLSHYPHNTKGHHMSPNMAWPWKTCLDFRQLQGNLTIVFRHKKPIADGHCQLVNPSYMCA